MYGGKHTLYDVLGVTRDASLQEIGRAYRRINAEMADETVPPDPRRANLVREAYEVLSDPQRRDAYDASLRGPKFLGVHGGQQPRRRWALMMGGVAGVLGALYLVLNPAAPPPQVALTKSAQEVQTAVTASVGRLHVIDVAGQSTPAGVAVAIHEGLAVVPCAAYRPDAQIVVRIPPRNIPAHTHKADEATGLCQLALHSGGSWPLPVTAIEPTTRQRVYVVRFNAKDEVSVTESLVKQVSQGPNGRVVELERAERLPEGTPLIDVYGRVMAVAMGGQPTMLPSSWVEEPRKPPPPAQAPEPETADPAPRAPGPRAPPVNVSPERKEALEKAFRPPPTVPDDL